MKKPRRAVDRIGRLADTLSEMTAPFGYRVVAVFDLLDLGLYVFDEKKTQAATLCVVMLGDSDESSAEALLRKYESKNSWTAFLCDGYEGLTFPEERSRRSSSRPPSGSRRCLKASTAVLKNLLVDI